MSEGEKEGGRERYVSDRQGGKERAGNRGRERWGEKEREIEGRECKGDREENGGTRKKDKIKK